MVRDLLQKIGTPAAGSIMKINHENLREKYDDNSDSCPHSSCNRFDRRPGNTQEGTLDWALRMNIFKCDEWMDIRNYTFCPTKSEAVINSSGKGWTRLQFWQIC